VASAERMSRSAAAFVLGYKLFDRDVDIRGVVLNRMGARRHRDKARMAVEKLAEMEVLGTVPRRPAVNIPERHLGLVPAYERERLDALFDELAALVEEFVDVDRVIEIAGSAPEMEEVEVNPIYQPEDKTSARLGLVRDECFTFYYEDTLDAFRAAGVEIVEVDSLRDRSLPQIDMLYIGGGFPEMFAEVLEKNTSFRESVRDFCESGNPCWGECGGLMYLGESITTKEGESYEMTGVLPVATKMEERFQALGYVKNRVIKDNIISRKGDLLLGHEFHHSAMEVRGDVEYALKAERGKGIDGAHDGIVQDRVFASYMHLHVLSYPRMVENFVGAVGEK
ncbi:MAG: hydrogenobyrinic acid a,c-diamide synthase (glutamine-hydrolyzing), partial [Euryarchaeota archaeon]|nr:hydrogenobyrinic acid a,c-diamide synthase (glutamine-hydrolyzing) [Euryarchaeota archaeon]